VKPRPRRAAALLAAVVALLAAAPARAELIAEGGLFADFQGDLRPKALPRHGLAPIGVWINGTIKTLSDSAPPALREIKIELNRYGVLDVEGLPTCPKDRIATTNRETALRRCGSALVGTGSFLAESEYPEQGSFPSAGKLLAFNGREGNAPVLYAHVYGTTPLESTRIITFRITHGHGSYGTVLTGDLPPTLNPHGFIRRIGLSLHRKYRVGGERHSYLAAGCPAAPGFTSAVFPFARASLTFSDGRALRATMTRSCRARG
jgi:hypothetical protein